LTSHAPSPQPHNNAAAGAPSAAGPAPFCLIGAGPCGLAAAKEFAAYGIPFDWFEREDDIGGNWRYGSRCSSMYASAHMISSKHMTAFDGFPMPRGYPAYPSHQQALAYLRGFARRNGLYERVTLNTGVKRAEPAGEAWSVELDNGERRSYGGLVIANGHHWDPLFPEYPGEFDGETLHSRSYRTPGIFRGKRVLIAGAGNSGCDIAVEAAQHASAAFHSLRRGYHFLPKFVRGYPIDVLGENLRRWRMPLWVRRLAASYISNVALGSPQRFGLPAPDHRLFEAHPVINSQLLYHAGHGAIEFRPEIAELCGAEVRFVDGSSEQIDMIVYATGYRASLPFIDPALLDSGEYGPELYLHAFHPSRENLFVIGLIQPDSGLWPLAELQARIAAALVSARRAGHASAQWFRAQMQRPENAARGSIRYINTRRHHYEVDHFAYRDQLRKILSKLPPPSTTTGNTATAKPAAAGAETGNATPVDTPSATAKR